MRNLYLAFLMLLISVAAVAQNPESTNNQSTYTFIAEDANGNTFDLSIELKDRLVLLELRNVECSICEKNFETLLAISEKYADKISVVSYVDGDQAEWTELRENTDFQWPHVFEGESYAKVTKEKYGVNNLPSYLVIAADGRVIERWDGIDEKKNLLISLNRL